MKQPMLETARLRLTPLDDGAFVWLRQLYTDPEVMHYFSGGVRTDEQIQQRLNDYLGYQNGLGGWLIWRRDSGDFVGFGTLKPLDGTDDFDVGYILAPAQWGQGLASEVTSALLNYGFRTLGLDSIVGVTHPENWGSRRVLEKNGLRFEAYVTLYDTAGMALYRLLRRDWAASARPA